MSPSSTNEPEPTSVAQREAAAALRLANEAQAVRLKLIRVAVIATAARRMAKRNADSILTLGASRSAVAPLWIMAALLAVLVGEGAVLIIR